MSIVKQIKTGACCLNIEDKIPLVFSSCPKHWKHKTQIITNAWKDNAGAGIVPERPRWQYPDLPWRKSKGTSRSATRTVKEIALWSNSKFQFLQHNKVMSTFRHVFWTQDTCWTLLESYLYVFEYIQHALMQLQLKNKLGPSSCPLRLQHSPFQPESWLWSVDLNSRAAIFYR